MTRQEEKTIDNEDRPGEHEAWDKIAEGFDRYVAPQEADLANEALTVAGLKPGERFLDVAAGTGGLSLPAARRGAHVVATDWSPAMIEQFEARVREEGLQNAKGRVMDCHDLEFDDDSFDVTGSQFGVMLVPDQPLALREMVRVTRPGGRVLMIAYASPEKFEVLKCFLGALRSVVPDFSGLPDDPPPLEFQASDPAELERRMSAAGLTDVRVRTTAEKAAFRSGGELWDWAYYSNPIPGMLVANLNEEQRARVRQTLDGMLRERSRGQGPAVLSNQVHIGIGTV